MSPADPRGNALALRSGGSVKGLVAFTTNFEEWT